MATPQQFIRECRKHLGEESLYTGEHPDWAWCAKFLSSCAKDIGGLGFDSWTAAGVYASCTPVADDDVEAGDLVCFNFGGEQRTDWFDHIGLVTSFNHSTGFYRTIEGNSGSNFDVGEYTYNNETCPPQTYFCRPRYTKEETDMTLSEDDVQRIADAVIFHTKVNDSMIENGNAFTTLANLLYHTYRKCCEILEELKARK